MDYTDVHGCMSARFIAVRGCSTHGLHWRSWLHVCPVHCSTWLQHAWTTLTFMAACLPGSLQYVAAARMDYTDVHGCMSARFIAVRGCSTHGLHWRSWLHVCPVHCSTWLQHARIYTNSKRWFTTSYSNHCHSWLRHKSRKLSANEQLTNFFFTFFFYHTQTAVSL